MNNRRNLYNQDKAIGMKKSIRLKIDYNERQNERLQYP